MSISLIKLSRSVVLFSSFHGNLGKVIILIFLVLKCEDSPFESIQSCVIEMTGNLIINILHLLAANSITKNLCTASCTNIFLSILVAFFLFLSLVSLFPSFSLSNQRKEMFSISSHLIHYVYLLFCHFSSIAGCCRKMSNQD